MTGIKQDDKLREVARIIISKREPVAHIELTHVLIFRDSESMTKAAARCYSFADHPIKFFTPARFAIVVYDRRTFYFSPEQMAILIYHELLHIPKRGAKLVDHKVKDFDEILLLGLNWYEPGAEVPDILRG